MSQIPVKNIQDIVKNWLLAEDLSVEWQEGERLVVGYWYQVLGIMIFQSFSITEKFK